MRGLFSYLAFPFAVFAAVLTPDNRNAFDPRSMVLTVADLPPGWQKTRARTFRTGFLAYSTPVAHRLRRSKAASHVVCYTNAVGPMNSILSQVIPFVDAADAASVLAEVDKYLLRAPSWFEANTIQRRVLDLPVVGDEQRAFCLEMSANPKLSRRGQQLVVAWRRKNILAMVAIAGSCTGRVQILDLVELALRQDSHIWRALDQHESFL